MIPKSILLLLLYNLASLTGVALAGDNHSAGHDHLEDSIGRPGAAAQVKRTVNIEMNDAMRFIPASITVKKGEIIRFRLKNSGEMDHEFVLGTEEELKNHQELMEKHPEMEHDDPNMITVAPGEAGEIIWHFTRNGIVGFACLLPGHFDAGMKGNIKVSL
jgi:uncharacterized cupredoxin-like copper-binding protein